MVKGDLKTGGKPVAEMGADEARWMLLGRSDVTSERLAGRQ